MRDERAKERDRITSSSFFIGQGLEEGKGLISFGSGQPDLPPPPIAFDLLKNFDGFKYGPVAGDARLREAVAQEYPGAAFDDIVITNGASEAIDLVLRAIAQIAPPDKRKVLLPRPYYYSYPHNVRLAGLEPAYTDLDQNGKINIEDFAQKLEGCCAVMINSPSNPLGSVQEVPTLKAIELLCRERGVYIISDEVYKDIIYARENYPMQGPHVVTVNSFSKTFSMCGLRVGYLYSHDRELVARAIEIKNHSSMNVSIVSQEMALAALGAREQYVSEHLAIWRARRDHIYQGMKSLGLTLAVPEGAFYVLPLLKHATRAMHDLYYNHQLITYNGAWFGAPDHLRFSYALSTEKIEEGLARLKAFLEGEYTSYNLTDEHIGK